VPGDKFNATDFCHVITAKLVQPWYPRGVVPRQWKFSLHLDKVRPEILQGELNFSAEKVTRLRHPPYSPDAVPSDFYLFGMLKEKFKNCPARTFDELKPEVDSILKSKSEAELISVFQTWLRRLQQVIDSNEEHIERANFLFPRYRAIRL
jgi:hypothetical protein